MINHSTLLYSLSGKAGPGSAVAVPASTKKQHAGAVFLSGGYPSLSILVRFASKILSALNPISRSQSDIATTLACTKKQHAGAVFLSGEPTWIRTMIDGFGDRYSTIEL